MLLYTNKNSDTPLYVQVVNQLKDMIVKGELSDGTNCPPKGSWQIFWVYTVTQ